MKRCVAVAHFARYAHHLDRKDVQGGVVACCFFTANLMSQFTCTADLMTRKGGLYVVNRSHVGRSKGATSASTLSVQCLLANLVTFSMLVANSWYLLDA